MKQTLIIIIYSIHRIRIYPLLNVFLPAALYNCIVLTAADVRCVVANTRKMANWMMCCMVNEESCCSIVRYSTCDNVACHLGAIILYYHTYSNSRLHEYTASSPLTSFTEEVKWVFHCIAVASWVWKEVFTTVTVLVVGQKGASGQILTGVPFILRLLWFLI